MFKNNIEDEADFCEAYKSQILNNDNDERERSPIVSILTILLLLAMIIALSIFGYKYIIEDNKNTNIETSSSVNVISDDDLKVTAEEERETKVEKHKVEKVKEVAKSLNELPKSKSLDVNDLADQIKINMSESEEVKNNIIKKEEKSSVSTTNSIENKYIEDLARLTAEIDKERNR